MGGDGHWEKRDRGKGAGEKVEGTGERGTGEKGQGKEGQEKEGQGKEGQGKEGQGSPRRSWHATLGACSEGHGRKRDRAAQL